MGGTAYPEVPLVVEKAYLVVATQLGLAEESPSPSVVEMACLVEAKVDVREGWQGEVEDRHSWRREEVACLLNDPCISKVQVRDCRPAKRRNGRIYLGTQRVVEDRRTHLA
jgi:hypothetical protein